LKTIGHLQNNAGEEHVSMTICHIMSKQCYFLDEPGGGAFAFFFALAPLICPGGYSGFQVTVMIEWRQKSKPKKSP